MRNLEKGQHIFIAFQNGKAVLDSQLRPRMYTSIENADRWTPTIDKGKIEYVEYAPTLTPQHESLTIEQLREMVGEPVYDYLGQEWYIIQEYYDHELLMTDGTSFEDDDELDSVDERFYRRPPEGEEDNQ